MFSRSGGHKTKETYPTRPGSPTSCKEGVSAPDKLEDHSSKGKGNEKRKERSTRGGRKEEKRKKAIDPLLVFIMATLEIAWGR